LSETGKIYNSGKIVVTAVTAVTAVTVVIVVRKAGSAVISCRKRQKTTKKEPPAGSPL
jgi:hypothetical protein